MNFDPQKYVYTYLILTIVITIIYAVMKCGFNINIFDKYLYVESTSFKLVDIFKYMIYHVFGYMILGYLFSNNYFVSNLIQTIFLECLLASMKNCNINEIVQYDVMYTAFVSIFVGMFSYYLGGLIKKYYS
jgi:hypothetical protein